MKQKAIFERDADGWWASRNIAGDNILGHGGTKQDALVDLEHQVTGFMDFLHRTRRNAPELPEITPGNRSPPISRA
jgi:hypothetical protein